MVFYKTKQNKKTFSSLSFLTKTKSENNQRDFSGIFFFPNVNVKFAFFFFFSPAVADWKVVAFFFFTQRDLAGGRASSRQPKA